MRICLLNGWEDKAETEIEKRMEIALKRIGHECHVARTTDQIIEVDPDLVLSLSFHFGKLTEYPTACIFWSPVHAILSHTEFFRHFLTFDAYLYATEDLRRFGQDACYATHRKFVGKPILASCHATEFNPANFSQAQAFYAGTNWDSRMFGPRYGDLLKLLSDGGQVTICGPAESWVGFNNVLSNVPFDGISLLDEMRRHGVVLCLHSPAHLQEAVPTARAFEAVAAGCVPIIDKHSFLEKCFGDDAFYIDGNSPAGEMRDRIVAIVEWVRSHPDEAADRVKRMHEKFCAEYSYDAMFSGLPGFLREVEIANFYERQAPRVADNVTYIVRTGERQGWYLDRCLSSLANQTAGAPHVVLIKHGTVTDFDRIAKRYENVFPSLNIIETERSGPKSIRLWQALNEVRTEFFGLLDDDDSLHRNHVAWLLRTLDRSPDAAAAYSATVRAWEGEDIRGSGLWKKHHAWPRTPRHEDETRHLLFYRDYNRDDMVRDNFVASPSYLARKEKIDPTTFLDPEIGTAEDWCLINMISRDGPLAFSWRASCDWTWRKSMLENASFGKTGRRALNRERLQIRGDLGLYLSSKQRRNVLGPTERQAYRDVDIVFAPKVGLNKYGWFSVHERPDGFVVIFGNAAFDGLNYDQKIALFAETDLVSLGNFVIKSPSNGEMAPREFSDFLVIIHPSDDVVVDKSIRVYSSDRFRGEFELNRQTRSLSSFGFSDTLIDSLLVTGPAKWLRRTEDGIVFGQWPLGVAVQSVRVGGHMKKPTYEHVIIALKGLTIGGEMFEDVDVGLIRLPDGIFFQARQSAFKILKDARDAMIAEDAYGEYVRFRPTHALNHLRQDKESPAALLLRSLLNLLTHPDLTEVAFGNGGAREFFEGARQSAFTGGAETSTRNLMAPIQSLRKRLLAR